MPRLMNSMTKGLLQKIRSRILLQSIFLNLVIFGISIQLLPIFTYIESVRTKQTAESHYRGNRSVKIFTNSISSPTAHDKLLDVLHTHNNFIQKVNNCFPLEKPHASPHREGEGKFSLGRK